MAKPGNRFRTAGEGINPDKAYPIAEAVKMVKDRAKAKFDETIEVAINLGVDPRHADQMVRGVVNLPNGSGRTQRVAVFARGAKADEARAATANSAPRGRTSYTATPPPPHFYPRYPAPPPLSLTPRPPP